VCCLGLWSRLFRKQRYINSDIAAMLWYGFQNDQRKLTESIKDGGQCLETNNKSHQSVFACGTPVGLVLTGEAPTGKANLSLVGTDLECSHMHDQVHGGCKLRLFPKDHLLCAQAEFP
jgi:hypothetical protein